MHFTENRAAMSYKELLQKMVSLSDSWGVRDRIWTEQDRTAPRNARTMKEYQDEVFLSSYFYLYECEN